jgi:hypothetical protein
MVKVLGCKAHGYKHLYVICPLCQCQYCAGTWSTCPRMAWHPAHGSTPEETGRRYALQQANRQESERRTVARGIRL